MTSNSLTSLSHSRHQPPPQLKINQKKALEKNNSKRFYRARLAYTFCFSHQFLFALLPLQHLLLLFATVIKHVSSTHCRNLSQSDRHHSLIPHNDQNTSQRDRAFTPLIFTTSSSHLRIKHLLPYRLLQSTLLLL